MPRLPQEATPIYASLRRNYSASFNTLPGSFPHKRVIRDLSVQRTGCSCAQSMAEVALRSQGIPFERGNKADQKRMNKLIPTGNIGIDPLGLLQGMQQFGIACNEYREASASLLVELLTKSLSFCILALQAPWGALYAINELKVGHYLAAGGYGRETGYVYVWDSGNGTRWGKIHREHLPVIWHDTLASNPDEMISGWMLHVPVTVPIENV